MDNPNAVDRTYVVSLKALREILKEISTSTGRWWVEEENGCGVVVGYSDSGDKLNNVLFEFPRIAEVPFPDGGGEIICLYPNSRKATQRGLYWEGERLLNDEVRDWESFWLPIRNALAQRYALESGVRSMSSAASSGRETLNLT